MRRSRCDAQRSPAGWLKTLDRYNGLTLDTSLFIL